MEETGSYVQRYAIDTVCKEFYYADPEPPPQLQEALSIIETVCKTSNDIWVNKQQCKLMADRFSVIAEELKVWGTMLQDGTKSYPALDKLLSVLHRGEKLVRFYTTWNGRVAALMDSQEAMFSDIIEELDTIKAQLESTSGIVIKAQDVEEVKAAERCHLLPLEFNICTIKELLPNKLRCLSVHGSDWMLPSDFFDSQGPGSNNGQCVAVPLSFQCEIFFLELSKGMAHLHPRDLKAAKTRLVCFDSTKGSRGHGCCDFGFIAQGWSSKHGNAYIFGIITCIQALKRNYMPRNTTSSICDEEEKSLLEHKDYIVDDMVQDSQILNPGIESGIGGNAICENSLKFVDEDEASETDDPESDSTQIVRDRIRNRVWGHDESLALLELTEEAMSLDVTGPDWNDVSELLLDEFGFDRASISCQQQWDALLHSFRAIQDHEADGCGQSYWVMNEDERAEKHLHTAFESDWFEVIKRILVANPALESETRILTEGADLGAFQSRVNHFGYANCEDEDIDIQSCDDPNQSSVKETVHVTISGEEGSLITSRIAPFLDTRIDDALKPLFSVLLRQEENELKHRRELLAIEEAKLALKREKLELRRSQIT